MDNIIRTSTLFSHNPNKFKPFHTSSSPSIDPIGYLIDEPSMLPYAAASAEHSNYISYILTYVPSEGHNIYLSVPLITSVSQEPILETPLDPNIKFIH